MKKTAALCFLVSLAGCHGVTFNTNVGPYAKGKAITTGVREYSQEEIAQYDAISLGFVEASFCQEKPTDEKPSRRGLVNDLKRKAHRLGGNGIVVESCGLSAAACQQYMECRALAYSVPERKG